MTIEQAFRVKFIELFPTIKIYPIVAPAETKNLYVIYKVSNRQIEPDLSNIKQMSSCVISTYVTAEKYDDVVTTIWNIIDNFSQSLGHYTENAPCVCMVTILGSNDSYDFDSKVFQSSVDLQFTFN